MDIVVKLFKMFQVLLHPEQDRVLTIREAARLQGFPDYYRFDGTVKQRYDPSILKKEVHFLLYIGLNDNFTSIQQKSFGFFISLRDNLGREAVSLLFFGMYFNVLALVEGFE